MFCDCVVCGCVLHDWVCLLCVWLCFCVCVAYMFVIVLHACAIVAVFCMIGVRAAYVWCMCGVLLVWRDVSWAVFVACIAALCYMLAYVWCMFWFCVA